MSEIEAPPAPTGGSGMPGPLNEDDAKTNTRSYCEQIGLFYLGDQFLAHVLYDAHRLGITQEQFDTGMRHTLWHIKWLLTPKNYSFLQRVMLAVHFLFGSELNPRKP